MTGLADSVVARMARQRDLLHDLNDQCRAIRVRATSRDRAITVEVDGTGTLTGLTLRGPATRLGANELAEAIVNIGLTADRAAIDRRDQLFEQFRLDFECLASEPLRRRDDNPT
jgi:hypothetical protein